MQKIIISAVLALTALVTGCNTNTTSRKEVKLYNAEQLFDNKNTGGAAYNTDETMNDVRVLPVESEEIVAGVKKNNIPVEYISFPDEGHGFVKKENQVTTSKKTLEFLDKYLYLHKEPFYLTLNDFQPHERSLYYLRGKNADW